VADRAEVYLRSLLPEGYSQQQATTLDRVAELVERGLVRERHVQVCGCQVPASPAETNTGVGERIVTRLAAFREWAAINDCSLAPAMEFREVEDSFAGTHYRAVRLPAIMLAEYRDGTLVCVTPHRDGDTVRTVTDRIGELETGDPPVYEPLSYSRPTTLPVDIDVEDRPEDDAERDTDERPPLAQR
jgi:hypothetical protein